ncbi:hypothetical protein DIE23_21455 [Burkholderia sp. Bp9143]|nr:hypothetical protein DIE23_21455 [Burkholderia sp. Bp9143]
MAGEPDAHDITMKHRPRVPCGDVGATPRGRARMPPATGRRSPSESRYKKFNKYFMREIL